MCGPGGQGSCKLQNPFTFSQSLHSDSVACEGDREEVQIAAVDIGLLHRRLGHMGKSAMTRLGREEMVRGLEDGMAGELGVCRGCELGKPLAKPHPSKGAMYRATKKCERILQVDNIMS